MWLSSLQPSGADPGTCSGLPILRLDADGLHAGIAVHKLAKLYKQLADTERAAHFYTFHLKRLDEEQSQGQDVAEALEFLATYNKVQLEPPLPIMTYPPSHINIPSDNSIRLLQLGLAILVV